MQNNDFQLKGEFINLLNVYENNPIILLNLLNEDIFSQYFDFYLDKRELIIKCNKRSRMELYVSLLDWLESNLDQPKLEELREKYPQLQTVNILDFLNNHPILDEEKLFIKNNDKLKRYFVFDLFFKEGEIKIVDFRKIFNIIKKVYAFSESEFLLEDCKNPTDALKRIQVEFDYQLLKELKEPYANGFSEWQNNTFFNFWNAYMLRKYSNSIKENFGIISGYGKPSDPFQMETQKLEKDIAVKNEEWVMSHIPLFNMYFLDKKEDMEKIASELELLLRVLFLNRYTSYIHISCSIKEGRIERCSIKEGRWGKLNEKLQVLNETVAKSERKFRQKKLEELLKAEIDSCLKEAEKLIKPLIELH